MFRKVREDYKTVDGAPGRQLKNFENHDNRLHKFAIYSYLQKSMKPILIFIGWTIAGNMAIHMSVFGWLSRYMPLWVFFTVSFILSLPIAWYLTKGSMNPCVKEGWKNGEPIPPLYIEKISKRDCEAEDGQG